MPWILERSRRSKNVRNRFKLKAESSEFIVQRSSLNWRGNEKARGFEKESEADR
jgi:hypothetical protein